MALVTESAIEAIKGKFHDWIQDEVRKTDSAKWKSPETKFHETIILERCESELNKILDYVYMNPNS